MEYTVHATIKYLGIKGYKVSAFMPGREIRIYTAQTLTTGIRAIARELRDISRDLEEYAKALDDTSPYADKIGKDLKIWQDSPQKKDLEGKE